MRTLMLFLVLGLAMASSARAQDLLAQVRPPHEFKPVAFNQEVKDSIGAFTSIANTIFKPAGDGPFPAVVLMHTCGGLNGAPGAHMKEHARELLETGHVVLVIDSYGPRGYDNCRAHPPSGTGGIADAYAALALLASKPFVDGARIYQAGYSWGAFIAALLASPQSARLAGSERRFAATVANYGSCGIKDKRMLLDDTDRPVLLLIGGRDDEAPSAPCFPLLDEMKAAGKPVQWHVYPETTHGWDKQGMAAAGYVYDSAITKDANARMVAFFSQVR